MVAYCMDWCLEDTPGRFVKHKLKIKDKMYSWQTGWGDALAQRRGEIWFHFVEVQYSFGAPAKTSRINEGEDMAILRLKDYDVGMFSYMNHCAPGFEATRHHMVENIIIFIICTNPPTLNTSNPNNILSLLPRLILFPFIYLTSASAQP
jgi:hypothetical protein